MINGNRILVVDDEEKTRKHLNKFLTQRGYTVGLAKDGRSGLKEIKKTRYDLALVDIVMEDERAGLDLLQEINKLSSTTVPIVITGYGSIESYEEAKKNRVYDYLIKPIKGEQLNEVVERGLELHRELEVKMKKEKRDEVYAVHKEKLEEKDVGKFVALSYNEKEEPIVGEDEAEVIEKALEKFGKGGFFLRRIGYETIIRIGGGYEHKI
ncbi:MAG: response regulator [bacterium]